MSGFAYRDKERKIWVMAEEALREDRGKSYFCPNKDCDARLHVVDGITPYFAANRNSRHRKGCTFASIGFDISRYDTKGFDVDKFVSRLLHESEGSASRESKRESNNDAGHPTVLPIRTLNVLYDICKSHKINDYINKVTVFSLLLDERTFLNYPIEDGQFKIVECRAKKGMKIRYDKDKQMVVTLGPNRLDRFTLQFPNRDLFWEIKDKMYTNSNRLFVVAGIWEKEENNNSYACDIVNKKQVLIVK